MSTVHALLKLALVLLMAVWAEAWTPANQAARRYPRKMTMAHRPTLGCSRRAAAHLFGAAAVASTLGSPIIAAAAAAELPADWASAVDPGSGNTFYYNKKTNESSWDPPAAGKESANAMRGSNRDVGACKSGE